MRIFNQFNFSFLKFSGDAAHGSSTKSAGLHGAVPTASLPLPLPLPSDMESSPDDRMHSYAQSRMMGRTMAHSLQGRLASSMDEKKAAQARLILNTNMRDALKADLKTLNKMCSNINPAMQTWQMGKCTLESLLMPLTLQNAKSTEIPQTDGLHSSVTSLLNCLTTEGSGASETLRNAAVDLQKAAIFKMKSANGTEEIFTLSDFTTSGKHGIGKIDALNLSKQEKTRITQRLGLALTELHNLGKAYSRNSAIPAPLMDRANCLVLASTDAGNTRRAPAVEPSLLTPATPRPAQEYRRPSVATRPAARPPTPPAGTMSDDRLVALAGAYLSAEELQAVFDGHTTLSAMAPVINERANQQAQNRDAGTTHSASPTAGSTPEAQPAASASTPPSASPDSGDLDLFDKLKLYLTPDEYQGLVDGRTDPLDYLEVIEHRIEDGRKIGVYDLPPAYGDETTRRLA